jgi:hypothetical protein
VLANIPRIPDEEVRTAIQTFDAFARDGVLIDILLESDQALVITTVLEHYRDLLSTGARIELLQHPAPEVRLAAINALKDTNDIGALKLIIDAFEMEREEQVRQRYKEVFWVIRNRETN